MQDEIDEVSIQDILKKLWARRRVFTAITVIAVVASVVTAFSLPEKYQASVVMAVVSSDGDAGKLGGAGALLSQFGGLAGLSSLGGSSVTKRYEIIATLQSSSLTEEFIREKNLLPILYEQKWNSAAQQWKADSTVKSPSLWKGELKFRKDIRTVTEDKKSGLVTLTITWTDPRLAAEWASELVTRTNSFLRQRAIDESQRNLDFLNEQAGKTSILELQKAIYGLTEAEIKKIMLAKGSNEYALRVIDPARIAEERVSPKRALIIAGGFLTGVFLAFFASLAGNVKNEEA